MAKAQARFNEAGAIEPRKRQDGKPDPMDAGGFNEAGAIEPRKRAFATAEVEPAGAGFNEAGAIEPRKLRRVSISPRPAPRLQ